MLDFLTKGTDSSAKWNSFSIVELLINHIGVCSRNITTLKHTPHAYSRIQVGPT
jgi:hypothetical protein